MIEDREIWACANLLVERHRDDALRIAPERAEALLAEGAVEGHRTFLRIAARIEDLQAMTKRPLH